MPVQDAKDPDRLGPASEPDTCLPLSSPVRPAAAIGEHAEPATMSEPQDLAASEPEMKQERRASKESTTDDSDREPDNFEDAVDNGSVRSLTGRKPPPSPTTAREKAVDADVESAQLRSPDEGDRPNGAPETETTELPDAGKISPKSRLSQASAASLDIVNLDDDSHGAATAKDKTESAAALKDEKSSPTTKEHPPPSKTLSLSSFTGALPSLPWSPPTVNTEILPPKHPPAPSPNTAAPPPVAFSSRKLTSPFSWLSRSASKDTTPASPPGGMISPRRNTASAVATLTSNPEMMLSKLEEERDGDSSVANSSRNSLKDRFKMLRMREETGISMPDNDHEAKSRTGAVGLGVFSSTGAAEEKEGAAQQPASPPAPASPHKQLAPGTASGVNAGPSSLSDVPVDWDLWQSVVYEGPAAVARTSAAELNKAIATGIPSAIRGVVWQVLTQSKNEELEKVYRELVVRGTDKEKNRQSNGTSFSTSSSGGNVSSREPASSASSIHSEHSGVNGSALPSPTDKDTEAALKAQAAAAVERKKREKEDQAMLQKLEKTIRRDLGTRTSYSKFAAAQGLQEGLFGVCKAYALYDEGVGYAQGMNFLVMPILFNMPDDEAFCLLVRLMNHYHLRDLFIQDMPGLHMHLYQFERLLEDLEPALYCHLHRRGISPHLYATQWFLTLFAYRFPLQLVLRIYDLILSEGLSAILRFGLVLMQKNSATLLAMSDMSQLTSFLKDRLFDVYIDVAPSSNSILENGFFGSSSSSIDKEVYRADEFVRDACEIKITPELLKFYTAEWEEKTRAEREREAELETLRTANAGLTVKVRRLEERIETVDHEQAALATELVRTKVDNEELRDENESLKGQVRELRLVIERQPAEIEARWQLERDDLMKRNQNVHEENQRLEKELGELEEELVQTKMRYAEINSQHETLTRKWTDLKRQFD